MLKVMIPGRGWSVLSQIAWTFVILICISVSFATEIEGTVLASKESSEISLKETENLGNGTTISIEFSVATVYIKTGGTYEDFANTSLNYVFYINASSPVYLEGYRNTSLYYLARRKDTELYIANFNTLSDRFNLTENSWIDKYSDISTNTTTSVHFINNIVSIATTRSTITLPKNQMIYLAKMSPSYKDLSDFNFIINEKPAKPKDKNKLSKPLIAVIIICCTVFLMIVYYTWANRQLVLTKLKTFIEYEDLLLYEVRETEVQDDIELPEFDDERIDKKVMKYLKKAAKVAETTKQANGNVVAVFADRNGEIVDVIKNQQSYVSYTMTKSGRNTINIQKGEAALNAVKQIVDENASSKAEAMMANQSSKGRKGRAGVKVIKTDNLPVQVVPEMVVDDADDEESAPADTSPQIVRTRGNAMVKLNQVSPVETPTLTSRKGASTSSFDSTNNGTYINSTTNSSSTKISPTAATTSVKAAFKPSEIVAKTAVTSNVSSMPAYTPVVNTTPATPAVTAPATSGLYYFPPTSSFSVDTTLNSSTYTPVTNMDFNASEFSTYAAGGYAVDTNAYAPLTNDTSTYNAPTNANTFTTPMANTNFSMTSPTTNAIDYSNTNYNMTTTPSYDPNNTTNYLTDYGDPNQYNTSQNTGYYDAYGNSTASYSNYSNNTAAVYDNNGFAAVQTTNNYQPVSYDSGTYNNNSMYDGNQSYDQNNSFNQYNNQSYYPV